MTNDTNGAGVLCHMTPSMTADDISEAFKALDRNSWESSCKCCGTYYTGTFAERERDNDFSCPKCKYNRNCLGSPAGGMNLVYMMDD